MKNKSDPTPKPASKTKRLILWFVNPKAWSDWDRSKAISQYFLRMIERFFVLRQKPKGTAESFDTAVARFKLDEKALQDKALGLKRLSYSLMVMAVFLLGYGVYQFLYGSMKGVLVSVVEVGIALVLAFRYHFWYFQIKHRKLGCSIKEWFNTSFTRSNR